MPQMFVQTSYLHCQLEPVSILEIMAKTLILKNTYFVNFMSVKANMIFFVGIVRRVGEGVLLILKSVVKLEFNTLDTHRPHSTNKKLPTSDLLICAVMHNSLLCVGNGNNIE